MAKYKNTDIDGLIEDFKEYGGSVVNDDNDYMLRRILLSGICSMNSLSKLICIDVDESLLVSQSTYSRLLSVQTVRVIDISNTLHAKAEVVDTDSGVVVKSIHAKCFKSLYKLLVHLRFYRIGIPEDIEVEIM